MAPCFRTVFVSGAVDPVLGAQPRWTAAWPERTLSAGLLAETAVTAETARADQMQAAAHGQQERGGELMRGRAVRCDRPKPEDPEAGYGLTAVKADEAIHVLSMPGSTDYGRGAAHLVEGQG